MTVILSHLYCYICHFQNHTALSSEVDKLAQFNAIQYPHTADLMKGYLLFEVLCNHDYDFSCHECGFYPPVLITDVDKKCCFRLKGNVMFLQS